MSSLARGDSIIGPTKVFNKFWKAWDARVRSVDEITSLSRDVERDLHLHYATGLSKDEVKSMVKAMNNLDKWIFLVNDRGTPFELSHHRRGTVKSEPMTQGHVQAHLCHGITEKSGDRFLHLSDLRRGRNRRNPRGFPPRMPSAPRLRLAPFQIHRLPHP